jgi:cell division protein FtsA
MEGMIDLAEEVFHMPVRLGIPQGVGGLSSVVHNPIYATGVGLVLYGARARGGSRYGLAAPAGGVGIKGVLGKMKSWFEGNF